MDKPKPFSTLEELITLSDLSPRTANRRLAALKKNDRATYDALLNPNKATRKREYDTVKTLAYLASPSTGVTEKKPRVRKPGPKDKTPVGERNKVRQPVQKIVENIWTQTVVVTMDRDVKELYDAIKTEDDKRRFEMVVLILNDYVTGLYTIIISCDRQGGDYVTFSRWINNSPTLKLLYERAEKKRNKALKTLTIQEGEANLRKLITGYEVNVESITYVDKTLPNGTKLSIPQERKVQRKHVIPNVTAIMFGLTNLKSKKYKRFHPFQQEAPPAPDAIDSMDEKQLAEYIAEGQRGGLLQEGQTGAQP